jgi:type VI secretion system protein ImpC
MEAQTTTQVESSQPILLDQKLEQSLDAVISATTVNDKKERDSARGEIDLLIAKVMSGQIKLEGRVERALRKYISELDTLISKQVSAVLHHPKFQKLESTWRGLQFLVRNTQITKISSCGCSMSRAMSCMKI